MIMDNMRFLRIDLRAQQHRYQEGEEAERPMIFQRLRLKFFAAKPTEVSIP